MKYTDLRDFIAALEQRGELVRIQAEVDPHLEMTEIADRTLRAGGPALLFENPKGYNAPVLANLFGTEQRVALGMGAEDLGALREIGEILAYLRQPDPPKGMRDMWDKAPLLKQVLHMGPKVVRNPACSTMQNRVMRWTCANCPSKLVGREMPDRRSPGHWSSPAAPVKNDKTSAFTVCNCWVVTN